MATKTGETTLSLGARNPNRPAGRTGVNDWLCEAFRMSVSRRIAAVPRDFVLGETYVLVAHRKAIGERCPEVHAALEDICPLCNGTGTVYTPAIFHAFKPTRVEMVVTGDEPDEEIEALVKRGITPVKVERVGEPVGSLFDDDEVDAV